MTTQQETNSEKQPNLGAAWVIGIYLVLHVALLGYIGVMFWMASDMKQLLNILLLPLGFELKHFTMAAEKFALFRQLAIAACLAGIGGAVFMIREFYINFAYGSLDSKGNRSYLRNREIPRYILLPFSSVVLGPISIFLLQAGEIVFTGFSSDNSIPDYTVMAVSFLVGFSYHDSLKTLRAISRTIFKGREEENDKRVVEVPDVTGKTLEEALTILKEHNLVLVYIRKEAGEDQNMVDMVIKQSPPAGTTVKANERIDITVEKKKQND